MKSSKRKKKLGNYPYLTVLISTALALLTIGLFITLLLHANQLAKSIKENMQVQVMLANEVAESEQKKIADRLAVKPYILKIEGKPQIEYISKEKALELVAGKENISTEEAVAPLEGYNPLKNSYIIRIDPEYSSRTAMKDVVKDIKGIYGVFNVHYIEDLITSINKNLKVVAMVLIGFSIILLLTVIILIDNNIKLALFSQRFLIRSMQLVGAKASFIRRPFVKRAAIYGGFSGILSSAIIIGVLYYAYKNIPELELIRDDTNLLILFVSLAIFGSIVGMLSTIRAMNKYLKMSLDDLY